MFDEQAGDASLGQQAIVAQEQRLIRTRGAGGAQTGIIEFAVAGLVAQAPVPGIDRQVHDRDLSGRREGRRHGPNLKRVGAAARHHQPHPRRGIGLKAQRLDGITHRMAIKGKSQLARAGLDSFKVKFKQGDAAIGRKGHGFDQVEPGRRRLASGTAHETSLDQALPPFGQSLGIGDDGRSHTQHGRALFILHRGEPQGADCHIERRIGSPIRLGRVNPANCPAIGAAGIALGGVDQLHRPNLRCSGDRAAGE